MKVTIGIITSKEYESKCVPLFNLPDPLTQVQEDFDQDCSKNLNECLKNNEKKSEKKIWFKIKNFFTKQV